MPDTATRTLAEFLLARIAEDETDARLTVFSHVMNPEDNFRIHRRMLGECEAKRRIVELHSQEYPHRMYGCKTCREWEEPDWPCSTLRLLAQPYADHEAFRQEWRADA